MAKKVAEKNKKEITKEEKVVESIDTQKILNKLEKELKEKTEEFTIEIKNKIDEQIEFSVNKRMKEEEKKITRGKTGKIIRRDIAIILLLGVIGYFGYCLYDIDYFNIRTKVVVENKGINEENKNEEKENSTPIKEPEKEIYDSEYYIEKYGYLVDNLNVNDSAIYTLYSTNMTKETIPNELKLKIAYKNLEDVSKQIDSTNNMITLNPNDLLVSIQNVFGENATLNNEMFTYNNTRFMYYNNVYIGFQEENKEIGFLYKIIDAKEEENKLVFEIIIAKKENNNLLNSNNEIILENYNNEDIELYKEQLTNYKITYEKDNENYIFSSISNS